MFYKLSENSQSILPGIAVRWNEGLQHTEIIYLASRAMIFDPAIIGRNILECFFPGQKPENFRLRIYSILQLPVHFKQQPLTIDNAGIVLFNSRNPAGKQFCSGWIVLRNRSSPHAQKLSAISAMHFYTLADQFKKQLPEYLEVGRITLIWLIIRPFPQNQKTRCR